MARSISRARRRVFMIWLTTAPIFGATSPALTSSARRESCSFKSEISRVGLARAALDAILLRASAWAGSWAQQKPCGPSADLWQRSPSGLIALHLLISGAPPPVLYRFGRA